MIKLSKVSKKIKGQQILENINLNIEKGKCYGFVGYNGSGKTMLLRAVCGLMPVDEGEIWIGDCMIGRDIEFIQNAGIIIGETGFLNMYSGYENLAVLAEIQKRIGKVQILNTLTQMGLYDDRNKKVKKYSLGMKQRLRLAQAFMENPDILVLDEPFNALDKTGVTDIQNNIIKAKKEGKTILLTSHDERNIDLLCDKVFEMDHGKIISER